MPNRSIAPRLVLLAAIALAACSKDPSKAKAEAFENGNKYFAAQQYKEAIVEYRRAIQIDEKFGEARAKLAEAYLNTKDVANAYRQIVRAADLLPDNQDVQVKAGNLLLAAGKFEDARGRADHVLEKAPQNADALILRANALAGMKDLDGALSEMEKAAEADPARGLIRSSIGALQMAKGSPADAEAAFKQATEITPNAPLPRVAYANFLVRANRPAEAEAELKKAVEASPKDASVRRALVILYLATNRPQDAEPHLKALADNETDSSARFALARFYFATNRPQDAMIQLRTLAAQKATFADATLEMAAAQYRTGDKPAAKKALQEVLTQEPQNANAHLLEAEFYAQEQQWTDAITAAKAAVAGDPRLTAAYYILGVAYQGRREIDEAKQAFTEVLKLQPNATAAQLALAQLNLLSRDPKAAQQLVDAAALRAPKSPAVQATLIRSLLANQRLGEAEDAIKTFTTAYPKVADGYVLEGRLHGMRKNYAAAQKSFAKAEELDPKSVQAAAGHVQVLLVTSKAAKAMAYADKVLSAHPNDPGFVYLAGQTHLAARDFAKAEPLLRKTLELDPARTETYGALAQLYLQQGRRDQALTEFKALAEKQPKSVGAKTMIGTILQLSNRRTEAKDAYKQVLAIDSNAPVAANNLAWMLAEDGQELDYALQLAQTAKAGLPETADTADTLGWVYLKKGMADRAIPEFSEAITKQPTNAGFHYHLGFAYAKAGQFSDARQSLEKGLSLDAKAPEAAEARATLTRLSQAGS